METVDDSMSVPVEPTANFRDVDYRHSRNLPQLLAELHASLLISTYQAGKLAVIGARDGKLAIEFHDFDRPMGVAATPGQIAVGARNQVWFLKNEAEIAPRLEPAGRFDACYLARRSHVTGEIQCHEMAFGGDELWVVNTLFSCLCTLNAEHSFVPRWQPPFISGLAAEDRCHLNGLAMSEGQPKFVTALAETDAPAGWRPNKAQSGCLIEVASGGTVARGFAMPHSPRVHAGRVWLLDSGRGRLVRVNTADGSVENVGEVPGYARGLAIHGNLAFVGLSKIRETSTFGGLPIASEREELRCGVAVVELSTGRTVATFEFTSGVEEIFDVTVLSGTRAVAMRGPHAAGDDQTPIWLVPQPDPAFSSTSGPARP